MPVTSLYKCSKCKKEFNFGNIKYNEKGSLICVECLKKSQQLKKQALEHESAKKQEPVRFICVSCRFKFSVKSDSMQALKCPYCSKTKLMIVKRYKDENDLINDSMDHKFDY